MDGTLLGLPGEVLAHVFTWITSVRDVAACNMTCRGLFVAPMVDTLHCHYEPSLAPLLLSEGMPLEVAVPLFERWDHTWSLAFLPHVVQGCHLDMFSWLCEHVWRCWVLPLLYAGADGVGRGGRRSATGDSGSGGETEKDRAAPAEVQSVETYGGGSSDRDPPSVPNGKAADGVVLVTYKSQSECPFYDALHRAFAMTHTKIIDYVLSDDCPIVCHSPIPARVLDDLQTFAARQGNVAVVQRLHEHTLQSSGLCGCKPSTNDAAVVGQHIGVLEYLYEAHRRGFRSGSSVSTRLLRDLEVAIANNAMRSLTWLVERAAKAGATVAGNVSVTPIALSRSTVEYMARNVRSLECVVFLHNVGLYPCTPYMLFYAAHSAHRALIEWAAGDGPVPREPVAAWHTGSAL